MQGAVILIDASLDEVLKKIGRNMMLFQELEYLLKHIILNGNISVNAGDFDSRTKQIATVSKQTMGQLVGQYIQDSYEDSGSEDDEIDGKNETLISFKFRIQRDSAYYETKKEALASLVSERNELVHHLLPQFKPGCLISRQEIAEKLDLQSDKVRLELRELRDIAKHLDEAKKQLVDFLVSDDGKKYFEFEFLRTSRLVTLLQEITEQVQREDGWTLLNTAGQLIRMHAPEEIALLKSNYGYPTLKSLILACEMFEVLEEETPKGGTRVLYRSKSNFAMPKLC